MEGIKFDSCVRSNALNKTLELSGCLPPFLDTPGVLMEDTKWCSNSSEGQDAFKNYVQQINVAESSCLSPCSSYKAGVVFKNHQNLIESLRRAEPQDFNLFISFPSLVETIKAEDFYGCISYIAEFSGWLGLCLGLSVPGVFVSLLSKLKSTKRCNIFFENGYHL